MRIQDGHRPLEQVGQRLDDLAQPASAQDNGRESLVDCCRAFQAQRLGVQNQAQDGVDNVGQDRFEPVARAAGSRADRQR